MEKFIQFLNFVSYKYKLTFDDVMTDFQDFVKEEKESITPSTLEDDYKTYIDKNEENLEKMFGGLVASLVKELTSDKDKIKEVGKTDYLAQKMANMSSWALVIKLADRLDNVQDIATAKTPEWRRKYRAETESVLTRLEKSRELSGTHKKIIKSIRDKLKEIE